jgi:hypothetical protein
VAVLVEVRRAGDGGHPRPGEHHRDTLGQGHRLAEDHPGEHGTDERGRGEDQLRPSRAEVAGAGDPQRDRQAVPERPDHEAGDDRSDRRTGRDEQPDRQVGGPGDQALGHRDVVRSELVELGRDAVVDGPAHARGDDEERAHAELRRRRPRQRRAAGHDERGAQPDTPPDVLVEHRGGEGDGGDQLQVEQQRRGGSRRPREPGGQQHRCDGATDDDRHGEPAATAPQRTDRRRPAQGRGEHGECRADVQQAGEREGVELAGELRRRRGRGAEQHGGERAAHDGRPIHPSRMPDHAAAG